MNPRLAYVISVIFHPLLQPTLVLGLLLHISPTLISVPNRDLRMFLLQVSFSFTFLIPLAFIIIIRKFKVISSLSLPDRKERRFPFVIISIMYVLTAYLYWILVEKLHLDNRFFIVFAGICTSLIVLTAITFFYKISAHTLAMSGVFGGMLALAFKYQEATLAVPLACTAFCLGLVITARLSLKAHSWGEVIWAMLVGFTLNALIIGFLA
jgi:hypothetical protein